MHEDQKLVASPYCIFDCKHCYEPPPSPHCLISPMQRRAGGGVSKPAWLSDGDGNDMWFRRIGRSWNHSTSVGGCYDFRSGCGYTSDSLLVWASCMSETTGSSELDSKDCLGVQRDTSYAVLGETGWMAPDQRRHS
ncbi:hypothetical protein J1614_005403 [Plenodomus biglobosus]|nr:hypothetical protein J1614_005403 [Plenodomus biglobosus]